MNKLFQKKSKFKKETLMPYQIKKNIRRYKRKGIKRQLAIYKISRKPKRKKKKEERKKNTWNSQRVTCENHSVKGTLKNCRENPPSFRSIRKLATKQRPVPLHFAPLATPRPALEEGH